MTVYYAATMCDPTAAITFHSKHLWWIALVLVEIVRFHQRGGKYSSI